jgi:transcriptional regulator with XRE-family HTH domain
MTELATLYGILVENRFVRTQQDLATALDISRPVISQLLSGKQRLTEKHIRRISEVYKFVNPDWLRTGMGAMFKEDVYPMPDPADLERLNNLAQQYADEKEYYADLERRAVLYDAKAKEVKELYAHLSATNQKLSEKESEIYSLQQKILALNQTIQQLRGQIAGLLSKSASTQSSGESK